MKKLRNVALVILAITLIIVTLVIRVNSINDHSASISTTDEKSEYVQNITNYDINLLEKFLIFETGSSTKDDSTEMLYIGCATLNRLESGLDSSLEELIRLTYSTIPGTFERMIALDELSYNDVRFVKAREVIHKLIVENYRPLAKDIFYYDIKEHSAHFMDVYGNPIVETENLYFFNGN